MMEEVVCLQDYSLSLGYSHLLRSVSFSVMRGESLAIVGPAGSGKTILLSVLGQVLSEFVVNDEACRQSGNAFVLGEQVAPGQVSKSILKKLYAKIGFVGEQSSWLPLSVAENFQIVQQMWGLGPLRTFEEIIESFPLSNRNKAILLSLAELSPHHIELPLLQQMAILRALLRKPALLLLDEPFARMDPVLLRQTENLISDMTQQICTVWATNDLHQASRTSDKVLFVLHGSAVECTPTARFFTNPQSREAENFIAGREDEV